MTLMDGGDRYGLVSRGLHWIMAALLLIMLSSEVWFEAFEHTWSEYTLMAWHQSLGIAIFGLLVVRVLWRWLNRSRVAPPARWATMAKLGHRALYALMLLMPLSGLLTAAGEGDSVTFLGWTLLNAGPEVEWLEEGAEEVHETLATVFWFMIAGHVAAALAHQFLPAPRTEKEV